MGAPSVNSDFKTDQKKFPRVRAAYAEKTGIIKALLRQKNIVPSNYQLFIRAFKKEQILEVWVKSGGRQFVNLTNYPFCASSGKGGPKRKEGDLQIPEGFYHIDRFNPSSNFHLSLGINYPNQSDRLLGNKQRPGSNIFIHGGCETIGCIPLTNDKIKELYILAVNAKSSGQRLIPVHIFPQKLDYNSFAEIQNIRNREAGLINFWKNLKEGYDYFEMNRAIPKITIDTQGRYIFN